MVDIFVSRYAPDLKDGTNVRFKIGETVRYRMRSGEEHDIVIDSNRMFHEAGYYGYEAIFDDGVRAFAVEQGIVDWEGKK